MINVWRFEWKVEGVIILVKVLKFNIYYIESGNV